MKTNLEIDQRYIQEKLFSRVRIAVEKAETSELSILKTVSGKVRRFIQNNSGTALEGYPAMKIQIEAIETLVRDHAKDLSRTAADQNENVQGLSDGDFDNMAKVFERENSRSLKVTSPAGWV